MGRSTYDETFLGRTVTIDWDKSQCYDDGYMTKKDLNEDTFDYKSKEALENLSNFNVKLSL